MSEPDVTSWEDDGGTLRADLPHHDLNALLAQEQTSIMNAESASSFGAHEFHRDASLNTRQLMNATQYPEHEVHIFAQDRPSKAAEYDNSFRGLVEAMEHNERLLDRQFADGEVSEKSSSHRSLIVEQDRAQLPTLVHVGRSEAGS